MPADDDHDGEHAPGGDADDHEREDAPGGDADDGEAPGRDPDVDGAGGDADGFAAAPERAAVLREIAEDVRGESSESEQLANVLYRTSDIYDPDEDTTPEEVMQNVKFILEVKERDGLGR